MSQRDWIIDALGQPATTECVLFPWQAHQPRPNVWLGDSLGAPSVGAAALILSGSPRPSPEMDACHDPIACNNGRCVNLRHLRWDTKAANAADRLLAGTDARGEKCPTAKLTKPQIRRIRSLRGVMSQRAIATEYGVTQQHVSQIQLCRRWQHG